MTDTKKLLVTDPRISKISTLKEVTQAVKSGPKSTLYKEVKPNSVNSNDIDWSLVHQSDDTIIDPSFKYKATINFYVRKTIPAAGLPIVTGAPAAFPLNTITDSIVYDLNGSTHNVNLRGIRECLLKQYDQKTISEYNNTTPSYVDTLWSNFADAKTTEALYDSNPLGDSVNVNDDVVKRGSYPVTCRVFHQNVADEDWTELAHVNNKEKRFLSVGTDVARDGVYIIQCVLHVNEPLLGSPFDAFSNSQAGLVGFKQLGIKLNFNDCKNIYNDYGDVAHAPRVYPGIHEGPASVMGKTATNHPLDDTCRLRVCTINIHDSQYGSVKQQNTMPIVEYTALKTPRAVQDVAGSVDVISHTINLASIPDKFFVQVRLPYNDQTPGVSNFKAYPIERVVVTMNNVGNLLADRDAHQLFLMSKKNGCQQTWPEFKGTVSTLDTDNLESIGSYLVIDPVFDLNLADLLTSGSMGAYQVQFNVTFRTTAANSPYELNIVYSDSAYLNTNSGKSSKEKAYITKDEVLSIKSDKDAPHVDYQEFIENLSGGGKRKPMPLTGVGDAIKRSQGLLNAAYDAKKAVSGGGYKVSGGSSSASAGASVIDKYL